MFIYNLFADYQTDSASCCLEINFNTSLNDYWVMNPLNLPLNLKDKIFEIRSESEGRISKIVSYFPLDEYEKKEILSFLNQSSFDGFHSIFSDNITEEEWVRTKDQIKKKFQDELFDVDGTSH